MSFKTKKIFQYSNVTVLNLPFTDWNFPIVGNTDSRLVQLNSNVLWQHFSSVKTAMKIFPFTTELRTMHSHKAVSKRKWQRRLCWRSSFFTHLQTLSPLYFSPSFVRLTYFIKDMKLFCGSRLEFANSVHNPVKLPLFLSTKYWDSFPDWKAAGICTWTLNFFTMTVFRKGGAVPPLRTVLFHRMLLC